MVTIKKPAPPPYVPLRKKIFRSIVFLLKYPRLMARKYMGYNGAIGEILLETGDISIDDLRRRNNYLVNLFIHAPFFLGILISVVSIYLHHNDFSFYIDKSFSPIFSQGFFSTIGAYFKRIHYIFTAIPVKKMDYLPFIIGYATSILGAFILSFNILFKKQDEITHIFSTLGYIDSEGKPWKVTWTPNAIMIEAFNCDAYALCNNNRFWSSVNFPPTTPKINKENMNKFIVQRKYELPSELIFELKGDEDV